MKTRDAYVSILDVDEVSRDPKENHRYKMKKKTKPVIMFSPKNRNGKSLAIKSNLTSKDYNI